MAVQISFTTAETAGTAVAGNALDLALVQKDSATNTLILGNGTAVTLAVAGGGTGSTTAAGALTNLGAAPLASPTFTGVPAAPTAAAGTNTTQVATTAFATSQDIGVGQNWVNMTGSRALAAGYTNASIKPMAISVVCNLSSVGASFNIVVNGIVVANAYDDGSRRQQLFAIVPPGYSYSANAASGTVSINYWSEFA